MNSTESERGDTYANTVAGLCTVTLDTNDSRGDHRGLVGRVELEVSLQEDRTTSVTLEPGPDGDELTASYRDCSVEIGGVIFPRTPDSRSTYTSELCLVSVAMSFLDTNRLAHHLVNRGWLIVDSANGCPIGHELEQRS